MVLRTYRVPDEGKLVNDKLEPLVTHRTVGTEQTCEELGLVTQDFVVLVYDAVVCRLVVVVVLV